MAWKPGANAPLGIPNGVPTAPDATAQVAIGTISTFIEDTLGGAELIYLPGVAGLLAGDIVDYDLTPGAQLIVRHTNVSASNTGRPVAWAISNPQAGQFGWFQISGCVLANTFAASGVGNVFGAGSAGKVISTADAGDQILNARQVTAEGTPSAGKSYVMCQRPFVQGQIT